MIIDADRSHINSIWKLNEKHVPHVSSVSEEWFVDQLKNKNLVFKVKLIENTLAGFLLCFPQGENYSSENYLWFERNSNDFLYLDRIVVDDSFQGQGFGREFYTDLLENNGSKYSKITCEVNIKPINEGSLLFHQKLGFVEVGQQDTDGGKKRVSLLSLEFN